MKQILGGVTAPTKFVASGVACGIKKHNEKDLAVVLSEREAQCAGVFTENVLAAAPVLVTKKQITQGICRAVVMNSGCANAFTGERGIQDALTMAEVTANSLGIDPDQVAVASTGIIGDYLPMEQVKEGIVRACGRLTDTGGSDAAEAIMTTDTVSKEIALEFSAGANVVRVGGMGKGSGMIAPNMATMLAFITTDLRVDPVSLATSLKKVVSNTFNMISVDGETSTNDMVLALANGASGVEIKEDDSKYPVFEEVLEQVCSNLAKMIVKDGEGATKYVELTVKGAQSKAAAREVGMAIANSVLVKTAFFGEDANLGRIIAAAGHAGVDINPAEVELYFASEKVAAHGGYVNYDKAKVDRAIRADDIEITLIVGKGAGEVTIWTTDLSHEYIEINSRYTT